MADKLERYFIAIVPPEPFLSETQSLRVYMSETYSNKASLNSPPHITLHMPFRWKEKKEQLLIDKLASFAKSLEPFSISLQNFAAFPPRVIYVDVLRNDGLVTLQKSLERFCKVEFQLFNANRLNQAYHPHLTVAFRDLKKDKFKDAWAEFSERNYSATFICTSITLLKQEDKQWHVLSHAYFTY